MATSQVVLNNSEMQFLINVGKLVLGRQEYQKFGFQRGESEMFVRHVSGEVK